MDAENLVGVVQIENILIFAESYDIALDITFPKGELTPGKGVFICRFCLYTRVLGGGTLLCRSHDGGVGGGGNNLGNRNASLE